MKAKNGFKIFKLLRSPLVWFFYSNFIITLAYSQTIQLGDSDGFGIGLDVFDQYSVSSQFFDARDANDPFFTDVLPVPTDFTFTYRFTPLDLAKPPSSIQLRLLTLGIQDGDSQVSESDTDIKLFIDGREVLEAFDSIDQFDFDAQLGEFVETTGFVGIPIPRHLFSQFADGSIDVRIRTFQLGNAPSTDTFAIDYSVLNFVPPSNTVPIILELSKNEIRAGDSVDVFGQVSGAFQTAEQTVRLNITAPDGLVRSLDDFIQSNGQFDFKNITEFHLQGDYVFKAATSDGFGDGGTIQSSPQILRVSGDFQLLAPIGGEPVLTTVVFHWDEFAGALADDLSYNLIIAEDPNFEIIFARIGGIIGLSTVLRGFESDKTYYWFVEAVDLAGNIIARSAKSHFTTSQGNHQGGTISGLIRSNFNDPISGAQIHNTLSFLSNKGIAISNPRGEYIIFMENSGNTTLCGKKDGYFTSDPVMVSVSPGEDRENINITLTNGSGTLSGGLINMSANTATPSDGIAAGFIFAGTTSKRFVFIGENEGGLQDPEILITNVDRSVTYDYNDNWQDHITNSEILSIRSPKAATDAALATSLPGVSSVGGTIGYLAILRDKFGLFGRGNIQINDPLAFAGNFSEGRIINMSTNTQVPADGIAAGFIFAGTEPRRFAIIGENEGGLDDPEIMITNVQRNFVYATNDDWASHDTACEVVLGVRSPKLSSDSALAVTLPAHPSGKAAYLAILRDKNGKPGRGNIQIQDITP